MRWGTTALSAAPRKTKKMTKDNNAEQRSGHRDKPARTTPSAARLKQIFGDSPTPRNLTPYEIDLLRKSKQEMAQVLREVSARKKAAEDQDETRATMEADKQREDSR